jgi:hypothetical protein
MPRRMMRRAAVLGATAHVASKRGQAKAEAQQEAAAPAPGQPAAVISPPVADAAAAEPSGDPYDDLMKLKQLLDAGALTQEEFDTEKQKLLAV